MKLTKQRFALGSYHYLRYPLDYFLDTALELEISTVELWAAAPQLCLDTMDAASLSAAAKQVRTRGLQVCCVTPEQCTYPINLAAEDEALRQHSIRNFERAVQAAQELCSPMVLVTAGCGYFNQPTPPAWQRSMDSLQSLAHHAAARGVTLALETLTPLSSNLLNTPEQQRDMLDHLPPGSAVAVLDIGQMAYMQQDISRYLAHGVRLGHVHLQDFGAAIHMALGDGQLPLELYLLQLEQWGYQGTYAFELNDPRYRQDPRDADRRSVNWLKAHNFF